MRINKWCLCGLAFSSLLFAGEVSAHDIRVSRVRLTDWDEARQRVMVTFDLAWKNAWRDAGNWDAAWVFVKVKPAGSNDWRHATLSPEKTDHLPVPASVIDPVPEGTGVFVYRSGLFHGEASYPDLKVCWTYGDDGYAFANGTPVAVSVHAIEMVHVPQGPFLLGSTGAEDGHFYAPDETEQTTNAYAVTSEDAIGIGPEVGKLWGTSTNGYSTIGPAGTLPAAYPKGYRAFYCMKHEGTQGQYAEFLNQLTELQAANRYPVVTNEETNRFAISGTYPSISAAAPDRACNWLSWRDGCAYLAWAGLRPMTELEYEKTCRGPALPVPNEYAWGNAAIVQQTGHAGTDGSGTETGTAASGTANCNYNKGISGPVRAGIYATATSTREQAGAGYWGILELTGNLFERCKTVGNDAGRTFDGVHGTGALTDSGSAQNATWANGMGRRGGGFSSNTVVSDRYLASHADNSRYFPFGFRCVRTAP